MNNKDIKKEVSSDAKNKEKIAPYNICDRFCERCSHTKNCSVFKDINAAQIKDVVENSNPHDVKNAFNDLEKSFKEIKSMLKKMAKEEGIALDKASMEDEGKCYEEMEERISRDYLSRKSLKFADEADGFLRKLFAISEIENPFLVPALNNEINDLSFYFPMVSAKIDRALSQTFYSCGGRANDQSEDVCRSVCFAINASLVCERAVGNVMKEAPELCAESLQLLTVIQSLRKSIKRKFPSAGSFKGDMIFNTKIR